jgi:HD-GYP domain-containing protein (c-di-GMP phosphodiesterase class II)
MPDLKHLLESHKLQSTSLLRGVELGSIEDLLQDCPIQELEKDDVLISAGQPNRFLYLLLSGRLRIHLKELTLPPIVILEPGEVAGELSVIDCQLTSAYVVAHEDCRLLVLDEETIWSLVESYPIVARNLLFVLSKRLRHGNVVIETSLLERVSEEELEDFQPQEVQEGNRVLEEEIGGETNGIYLSATAYVLVSIRRAEERKRPDIKLGEELVKQMIDSISESSALLLLATDRRQEFSLTAHSINVAILSLRLAQTLKYDLHKQVRVGIAALLHEIGVVLLPKGMIYQTGQVSPQVRQRPAYGAKLLQELCPEYDWLAETVGQVYEREDGSGSPLGLEGESIREEAKILGVVDVFEACIHDRPYRKASTGYQFLHELIRGETKSFSEQIVKALIASFSLYPYNEYVVLNTHELGQVVAVNAANLSHPVIKILYDRKGRLLDEPREIDLAQNSSLFITKAIPYHELPRAG